LRFGSGRIRVESEATAMSRPRKEKKAPPAGTRKGPPKTTPEYEELIDRLVEELRRVERGQLGPDSTFEERQGFGYGVLRDVLKKKTDVDMKEAKTTAEEVEISGVVYRRLSQASSATYFSPWGAHPYEEPLYRAVGQHDGPTVKPIEVRLGLVEHMTPDLARMVGELSAEGGSREVARLLKAVGYTPPSRAFLEERSSRMNAEIAELASDLEEYARHQQALPEGVASVSTGLDRMSVRMGEVVEGSHCTRSEPYERTPPPEKEYRYRQAWVGSTSVYDADGRELRTWRYGVEASADPEVLAKRAVADVQHIIETYPEARVHCVQDAAPVLRVLPEMLRAELPPGTPIVDLVDFEHLMGYLEKVVDAREPDDPRDQKARYRADLLNDDRAIDYIYRNLREIAKRLPKTARKARSAVAAALSYIRTRKDRMRYASYYQAGLPIGSGPTENTCWLMQQRVKRPGQSWDEPGLRGVMATRALVLSERWPVAWELLASLNRAEVHVVQ
jgi:hypothetical protein